jgi:hypothetical protein
MPVIKVTTWLGSVDSDFDTAGNWSNGLPEATGMAVIDGTVDITGGAISTVCKQLYVSYSYTGSIGSAGTPIQIDVDQIGFDCTTSSETAFIDILPAATTPTVFVDGSNAGSALVISGDINRLVVASTFTGTVTLGNSAVFTADIKDMEMMAGAGTVDASNASNVAWVASAEVRITGGLVIVAENFGDGSTCTVSGGTLRVDNWVKTGTTDSIVVLGGIVSWLGGANTFSASAVNGVNIIKILGGTFTMATNAYGYVSFGSAYQFGGTLDLESSFASVEFVTILERYSGTFVPPKTVEIDLSRLSG